MKHAPTVPGPSEHAPIVGGLDCPFQTQPAPAEGHGKIERVATEEALRKSEALKAAMLDAASDCIITMDDTNAILEWNAAAERTFGFSRSEVLGRDMPSLIIPPEHREAHRRGVSRFLSVGHGPVLGTRVEIEALRANGSRFLAEITFNAIQIDTKRYFTAYLRDITERKRAEAERKSLEERLRKAEKMETVGQLTGGIAHDFNNLLTVILGNAEVLAQETVDEAQVHRLAGVILQAAERGAELTQHLLAFGRRQSLKPSRVCLDQEVQTLMPLLQRTLGEHIELRTELGGSTLLALTDRSLLESAMLNLVFNARDAMPAGGVLTLQTGSRIAIQNEGALPIGQDVVFVTVSDTGTGMSREVLERAFEPFFTTKEVGKGSGLGLSMVYGFAQQSGGHVSIQSEKGVGTSVTLVLPGVTARPERAQKRSPAVPQAGGASRVLLVEDEAPVLLFVAAQLTNLGYSVEAVANGPDALDLLQRDSAFDLLFTDVMLPKGMSGVELARQARAINPSLKVLLTSGYPEEVFQHHGRPSPDTLLLRKPYRRKQLADMLNAAMNTQSKARVRA